MSINNQQKQLIKVYTFVFVLLFVFINWNNISWIFNYRAVGGLIVEFFSPYPQSSLLVSADQNLNNINKNIVLAKNTQNTQIFPYTVKSNSIQISSIGIEAPIVIGQTKDNALLKKELDRGTVLYPGSVLPGQSGQVVILGHSAPPNWPKIKYDWVFSELNNLDSDSKIVVNFNNKQFTYKVVKKSIVKKGDDVSVDGFNPEDSILTLISCWPPGKNYKRIVVQALLENVSRSIKQ